MSYGAALVLVLLAAIFLIAGFVAQQASAFVLAVMASGASVVLLAQRVKSRQVKTFVTEAPPRTRPAWLPQSASIGVADLPVDLEIDHVIEGYRSLLASEILPSLETLSTDELRKVIHVESNGRNRQLVIKRAQDLIDLVEGSVAQRNAVIDPDAPLAKSRRKPAPAATRSSAASETKSLRSGASKAGSGKTDVTEKKVTRTRTASKTATPKKVKGRNSTATPNASASEHAVDEDAADSVD